MRRGSTIRVGPEEGRQELRKHRVSFDEARTVFADPLGRIVDDPEQDQDRRWETPLFLSTIGEGRASFPSASVTASQVP